LEFRVASGLPAFSWFSIPNDHQIYQMTTKYNKWPWKYQMAIKYHGHKNTKWP
jgi:hypothetical protein